MSSERPSETTRPSKKPRASWKHLFAFTQTRHLSALVPAIFASCAVAGFKTSLALAMGLFFQIAADYALGTVSAPDTLVEGTNLCVLLCGLGAGHWLANTVFLSSWVVFGELQARSVREKMFDSLLEKKMAWYDAQADGMSSLLVRIETQTRELQLATSQVFGFLVSDMAVSIACMVLSFYMSWKLTLVLLATLPISFFILAWISRPLEPAIRAQKSHLAEASKYTNSSFTGIDLVKVYSGFDQEVWQYTRAIKAAMKKYLIQARCNAMQMGYAKFWIVSLFVVGFWYGLVLVDQGATPMQIITTFYATLTALQGIENLMPQWLVLAKGMSAGQALQDTVRAVTKGQKSAQPEGTEKPKECVGDIEVIDASFAYPTSPNNLVLQKSSFFFPAGETCFIVGRSGSGKSTLGNLLVKFYEPGTGDIFIDGRPLRTLDDHWVRENITLIQQSNVLFNDTFYNNVALGHENPDEVTPVQIRKACDSAMLHTTLATLPQGLDTFIGTGGFSLSGGQKQRLALARARLRDPPVLILDEVTSGLDHISKTLVMEAIRVWRRGKTTIIITHDLSQIQDQDYVFVMNKSRLVQEGFRTTLSQEVGGFFSSLLAATDDTGELEDGGLSPIPVDDLSPVSPVGRRRDSIATRFSDVFTKAFVPLEARASEGGQHSSIFRDGTFRSSFMQSQDFWGGLHQVATAPQHGRRSSWDAALVARGSQSHRNSISQSEGASRPGSREGSIDVVRVAGQNIQASRVGHVRSNQLLVSPTKSIGTVNFVEQPSANESTTKANGEDDSATPISFAAIIRSVWRHLTPVDRLRLLAGVAFCIIVAVAGPIFSYVFAGLLAAFWSDSDNRQSAGQMWAIILLVVSIIDGLATGAGRYLMEYAGQAWVNTLRLEALMRILQQPKPWFDKPKNSAGRINECLDRNAEEMRNLVGRFAPIIIIVIVMVSAAVVWALIINWKLTFVALAGVPVVIAAVQAFSYTSTRWETNCNKGAADTSAIMTETFTNIRVVKGLTLEGYMGKKYEASVSSTFKLGLRRALYTSPIFGVYQSINFFLLALIFYYAMILVARDYEMSPVQFQQVTNLLVFSLGQAASLLGTVPQIAAARATAAQMLGYASLPLQPTDNDEHEAGGSHKVITPLPIRANGLEFAYPSRPDNKVLRSLSLEILPNTSTAIVGSSGCGKSTFVSLLMALYTPSPPPMLWSDKPPQLTFSGIPFWEVDRQHLRSCMAFVPQTAFLFPATIAENISYGLAEMSPLRSTSNIEKAATAAGIHEYIQSLPDGYNTVVGEGGQALSGGQAQRVCIARALARRPKVLIMDEPTSALDAETAEKVRQTIKKLVTDSSNRGMATVIVTHSKEMMQVAEKIVVLDGGRVVEEGSFLDLRGRGGYFSRLLGGN